MLARAGKGYANGWGAAGTGVATIYWRDCTIGSG
jgi:hypothetical protein